MKTSAILLSACLAACAADVAELDAEQPYDDAPATLSQQSPPISVIEPNKPYTFKIKGPGATSNPKFGELAVSLVCMNNSDGSALGGIAIRNAGDKANYTVNIKGVLKSHSARRSDTTTLTWNKQDLLSDGKTRRFMVPSSVTDVCDSFEAEVTVTWIEPIP